MESFDALVRRLREISTLNSAAALLSWDRETYLPLQASGGRADQLALLSMLAHERSVSSEMTDLLEGLCDAHKAGRLSEDQWVNVRETKRLMDRERKLPTSLVEELSRAFSEAFDRWNIARQDNNFAAFAPALKRNVELQRQMADCYGFQAHPYDALLDGYEPGLDVATLNEMFDGLRLRLVPMLSEAAERAPVPAEQTRRELLGDHQTQPLVRELAERLGFCFERGRIDTSTHPFTTGIALNDVRFTVRSGSQDPIVVTLTAMHELGHALYEQGLNAEWHGLPLGRVASMGVHESQARFWENIVGRSPAFWELALPVIGKQTDIAALGDVRRIVRKLNQTSIRVDADELTYNLHILLRYELERELLSGRLRVEDVPDAWRAASQQFLRITPVDDLTGPLQDIHWAVETFGYFPTYALGNIYAAQIGEAVDRDLGGLDRVVSQGRFAAILDWLRVNIHRQGMRYHPVELIEHATKSRVSAEPLLRHLRTRYVADEE